jgi:dienelactone hydrolase
LRLHRIRSRRPLAPEFQWSWPDRRSAEYNFEWPADLGDTTPAFHPPLIGNSDPPLEVGRAAALPPVPDPLDPSSPRWDDPAWAGIPAFRLPRNEPQPRPARYPTDIKWMHDGRTLALLVRAAEPEQVVADRGGRDSDLRADDHIAIRLATGGARFVEILVNSVGAIRDWVGGDLHSVRQQDTSFQAPLRVQTNIRPDAWILRMDVPLAECARALGEASIPGEWRVLISRRRAPRPGEAAEISALPPTGSQTFYGPLRYRRLRLSDRSAPEATVPAPPSAPPPGGTLAAELAALDSHVWSPLYRRYHQVRTMLPRAMRRAAERYVLAEREAWEKLHSLGDWEQFRSVRLERLRQALGNFPPARPPLDVRLSARHAGRGYRLENLVYQSRPGFYVSANLYLPAQTPSPVPAIIIHHSFHYPKTQGELHDMGELWARAGAAVLIPERLGFGERIETTPWYRQAYASRFTFRQQLGLIGESFTGWMAWDLIRAVDLLAERPEVDRERIVLIGAVAGGAEPAAIAAALDERIRALVPFNYDHGHFRLDADLPGEFPKQLSMSFITASVAPRFYVRASEFGREGAEQPDFPNLWVDAWERSQKIWGFYGAGDKLAAIQGYGLIRLSMERVSHCFSVGPQQRAELYPLLERWFGIRYPALQDLAILPDSMLSTNPYREEARRQEAARRRPHSELLSVPPLLSAQLPRKSLHRIAWEAGARLLEAARAARAALPPDERRLRLRDQLRGLLGDIEPPEPVQAERFWTRRLAGVTAEAVALDVEEDIAVPLLLLRPERPGPVPVVVAVTKSGKDRFLTTAPRPIEALLRAGIAVCLPDLRGAGETAPVFDWYNTGEDLAEMALALGRPLIGGRLKDLRTVLNWLRSQAGIDARRIGLWGESFAPVNPRDPSPIELDYEAAPVLRYHSEPMGAFVALLAALYEDSVAAVAVQGGVASYLSLLESPFTQTPADQTIHGLLTVSDISDVAAALGRRPLLMAAFVNGRNERLEAGEAEAAFGAAAKAYRPEPQDIARWFAELF